MKKIVTQKDLSIGKHREQLQNLSEFPTTQAAQDTTTERKRLKRLIRLIQDEERE